MNLNRLSVMSLSLVILLSSSLALSQDLGTAAKHAPQDVFSAVPGDAWAVLCVPDVGRFDRKLGAFGQQLQAPMMVSIAMARMMAGIIAGFDDNGGIAVAVLPVTNMAEVGNAVVAFLPTTDYNAMVTPLSPETGDDGTTTVKVWDQQFHVAPFGKFMAMSPSAAVLAKSLKAGSSFKDKLASERLTRIQSDEITLWLNISEIAKSDLFNGFAAVLSAVGQDIDVIRQIDSASVSLHIDPAGLTWGLHVDADPDSELGKVLAATGTSPQSLLRGLPKDQFLFAMGEIVTQEATQLGANMMDEAIAKAAQAAPQHKELIDGLRKVAKDVVGSMRHVSMSVSALEPGSDGMIGVAAVITTDGASKRLCDAIKTTIASVKKAFADGADAEQYAHLVQYTPAAEKVAGVSVDHLKVVLPERPDAERWNKRLTAIIGKDQLLIRLATVDDRHLAITLGGGAARLKQVIESARSGDATLAEDQGIKRAAAHLPKRRNSEAYLAVDRVLKLVGTVAEAIGETNPIPVEVPETNAPLAIVSVPSGKSGSQTELFLPLELIRTLKVVALPLMMGRQQQQFQPVGDALPKS